MIRFVDLRLAQIAGVRFAYYDTIVDRFIEADGCQGWNSLDEVMAEWTFDRDMKSRLRAITPAWCEQEADSSDDEG